MNDKWWKSSTVYQIYPLSFKDSNGDGIGDIGGIIEKLDYLKYLGVDILWLSPIYESPMDDNGYDISDYYNINPMFGTINDVERLIHEVHKRGLKIIFDLVVNHVSDMHPWFQAAKQSRDNDFRDYFIWRDPIEGGIPTTQQSVFSGPAWEYDEVTNQYYYHIFSKRQPDLNWGNDRLREEIYRMMNWWMDKGLDGFRMDVIDHIGKLPDEQVVGNGPRLEEYLREMYEKVFKGRDYVNVGETPCASPTEGINYTKGPRNTLDMIFTFEHVSLDEVAGQGKWVYQDLVLKDLKDTFGNWQQCLYNNGWNSLYWSNHDQPRAISRFGDEGEYREKSGKMLATLLHFMQGTPYIYQGEEIGMLNISLEDITQYKDIETLNMYQEKLEGGWSQECIMAAIYKKGRDNARTPIQWDDSPFAGFSTTQGYLPLHPDYQRINVKYALEKEDSLFYYYQKLIQLRKELPIITNGEFQHLLYEHDRVFAYKRVSNDTGLIVICNFCAEELTLSFNENIAGYQFLVGNDSKKELSQRLTLSAYEASVFIKYNM